VVVVVVLNPRHGMERRGAIVPVVTALLAQGGSPAVLCDVVSILASWSPGLVLRDLAVVGIN
jgi:hypothetical protein